MATKPRTILTPGEAPAAPAQPVDAAQPIDTSVEAVAGAADEPVSSDDQDSDVMRQRVAATVFTFPDPEPVPAPKAEAPAAPAQPAATVVSNTPKLTKDGWVVPADFGAQPKRVG